MRNEEQCCGTCKYHEPVLEGDWLCNNEASEYHWDFTGYSDSCEEWEVRD